MGRQFKPGQLQTGSLYNISSSYALTASYLSGYVSPFPYTGSAIISGSLIVTGSVNAPSITGSLQGTASFARTASYVNPLNQNVIITGSIYIPDNAHSIYFSGSSAASRLVWNDTDGTLDLGLKGGNVTLQLGQETVVRVVNKTGANLLETDFYAVRVRSVSEGGAQGQRLAVKLAQSDGDSNSATTIGLVTENIANNQEGFITTFGNVNGINTTGANSYGGLETWSDGDMLYLSPTHPGYLTNVKPQAPNHMVVIGYVVYAHANNGKIFVKVDNGYEIDELHNVLITTSSLAAGQLLIRSGSNSTGVWINSTQLSGSYGLTGSLTATSFTGSLHGTSSYAVTASYLDNYIPPFPYTGSAEITGSLTVNGNLTASSITASFTGSLQGSASFATSASFAVTASYIDIAALPLISPIGEYTTATSSILAGTTMTLPNSLTYVSSSIYEYISVAVNGLALRYNLDFIPITTASIQFNITIPSGAEISYKSYRRP